MGRGWQLSVGKILAFQLWGAELCPPEPRPVPALQSQCLGTKSGSSLGSMTNQHSQICKFKVCQKPWFKRRGGQHLRSYTHCLLACMCTGTPHAHMRAHTHIHVHRHTHTHTCTNMHTHTHACTYKMDFLYSVDGTLSVFNVRGKKEESIWLF